MEQLSNRHVLAAALSVSLLILFSTPISAAPVGGNSEIEGAAGFFHAQDSDSGALSADVSYGYYLTPGWEIGFRQALNYNFVDDARDAWVATTTPFLNYNFQLTERVIPFLGAFIGAAWNDRDATGTLGPNAGVKFFLSDQTYLGLKYRYEWFFNSLKRAGRNADNGNHVFNLGIGFVW